MWHWEQCLLRFSRNQKEFYAGITLPKVFLTPSLFYYRDYGGQEDGGGMGSYTVVNLAKSLPFEIKGTPASLELAGHYGYNYKLFINGKGGDIGLSAGLKMQLTKNLTGMPNINYSLPLGDLEKLGDGKIIVTPVEEVIRIRTREKGEKAL